MWISGYLQQNNKKQKQHFFHLENPKQQKSKREIEKQKQRQEQQ